MKALLLSSVILAAVLSRPLELRLWRDGRLSDQTTAILLLTRFPAMTFLGLLIVDVELPWPALMYTPDT